MIDRRRAAALALICAALVAAADQYIKLGLVLPALAPGESRAILPGLLHLTLRQNTGAAFSLFEHSGAWVVVTLSLTVLIVFAIIIWPYLTTRLGIAAATLVLGGAVGNLIDRIRLHYVIDYLDFRVWPVFNLADVCVVVGVGLLVLMLLRPPRPVDAPQEGVPAS